jgi:hypothetical protein
MKRKDKVPKTLPTTWFQFPARSTRETTGPPVSKFNIKTYPRTNTSTPGTKSNQRQSQQEGVSIFPQISFIFL